MKKRSDPERDPLTLYAAKMIDAHIAATGEAAEAFAKRIGVTGATISDVRKKKKEPTKTWQHIARGLGMTADAFYAAAYREFGQVKGTPGTPGDVDPDLDAVVRLAGADGTIRPDFLRDYRKRRADLGALRGHALILDFYAAWRSSERAREASARAPDHDGAPLPKDGLRAIEKGVATVSESEPHGLTGATITDGRDHALPQHDERRLADVAKAARKSGQRRQGAGRRRSSR